MKTYTLKELDEIAGKGATQMGRELAAQAAVLTRENAELRMELDGFRRRAREQLERDILDEPIV